MCLKPCQSNLANQSVQSELRQDSGQVSHLIRDLFHIGNPTNQGGFLAEIWPVGAVSHSLEICFIRGSCDKNTNPLSATGEFQATETHYVQMYCERSYSCFVLLCHLRNMSCLVSQGLRSVISPLAKFTLHFSHNL